MQPARRIYSVPPGVPFLGALARALLAGDLPTPGGPPPQPFTLADTTLLLPTRLATLALQDAFVAASGGGALLLPRIRPIIGGGEEPMLLAGEGERAGEAAAAPPIGEIERRLALAKLVLRWSQAQADAGAAGRTPAQSARLARELARLMDAMEIEDVDGTRLSALVPEQHAAHWGLTLTFLEIVTAHWPAFLAERGLVSKMQHDKAQVLAQAHRWRQAPPPAPVIAAGVMSSAPAVTELLAVVAGLPNGALVLPGLDRTLDAASWERIVPAHPEHPQFGLKKLLDALGVRREDVLDLPGTAPSRRQKARARLVSEAMRPARTTERWHRFAAGADGRALAAEAAAGLAILEAPSGEEEAEAVALILREAAETPGRTAALVTPDRALARRVAARLATWGVHVADAAGQPFARTATGALLDLVVGAAARRFEPAALIALLKHPLCRLGMAAAELRRGVSALELAALRAPYFGHGLEALRAALERAEADLRAGKRRHRAVRRLAAADWQAARRLLRALEEHLGPLARLLSSPGTVDLATLVRAHSLAADALARGRNGQEAGLWQGEAGAQAARLLATLLDARTDAPSMRPADYPDFYRGLLAEETVAEPRAGHPRIHIWGPYQSRLQQPDVVVLASLNEGTWPQAADPGPWLNRPMRAALGLPAPEERIGDAAHIFSSLLGVEAVFLTRAAKIEGVPTVPSRWLLRLQALLDGLGVRAPAEAGQPWLAWAQARNALAGAPQRVDPPEPRPALALRPRRISVTAVERWIANPYALYADRILGLEPLAGLGEPPDATLRGQIVHDALGRFAARFPAALPADIAGELLACAREALEELTGSPYVAAFWVPRFERFAAWFAETEAARREGVGRVLAEVQGSMVLAAPGGPFKLEARADRIDAGAAGLVITDYKTGASVKDLVSRAKTGAAPQLPLEAAIAAAGGFAGVEAARVAGLRYISSSGGEPPGQEHAVGNGDAEELGRRALGGLERLVAAFDREATPYRALRRPRFSYRYDAYAHLARVAEWQADTDEEA